MVQAYDKAVNLVRRIEDRKDGKNDPEGVRDLYKSLALGPTIVQGYFEADSKRLGPAYTIGDYDAQLQLRDVLLSLKTLVGELSDVLLDDKEVDFRQLQDASDNCRVNAGVCLGQLSQRLAAPMQTHFQPPPQYMSGVPSMGSPGLHYSSSRSTHSSSGRTMPRTPEPLYVPQALSPQWQPKRQDREEQYYPSHQRRDTETDLRESYADSNWSGRSQLLTERDADELSMRRPSSHCLAPEDDALLSPGPSEPRSGQHESTLPGQQDLIRDSYTSFTVPGGSPVATRQSNNSVQQNRLRYGPDDYSPPVEQHGPFYIDRDSNQSMTSFASRSKHSTIGSESDHRQSAEPAPLRLPTRPVRQFSSDSASQPPRKPVPAVPYDQFTGHQALSKHTDIPVRIPSHIDGHRVPIPPRSDSRLSPPSIASQQRLQSPQPTGPPFQPSLAVQEAMRRNAQRQQYQNDRSAQHTPQPGLQSRTPSNQSSQHSSHVPAQASYQAEQVRHQQEQSQYPIPAQNPAQTQSTTQLNPQVSRTQQQPNLSPQHSRAPSTKAASIASVPVPVHLPLTLPDEKNTSPYCRGAFRLFLGLSKKTFSQTSKPVGLMGNLPYWRCDKCLFEGPMATIPGPPDKKGRPGKGERVFDTTIRECGPLSTAVISPLGANGGDGAGGIRFKWAFLAKCHVPQKSPPDAWGKPSGLTGSFGCLFCTAEGAGRGWTTVPGETASTFSGKSGNSGHSNPGTTPVFGNYQLFMDHLQMHRREENWPCPEMRGRMKCIVGRVADMGEDWEVNFLPL